MTSPGIALRFDVSALYDDPILRTARISAVGVEVPPNLSPEIRKVAVTAWEERTRSEYIGVMIVHHFHGLLVDLNAPMDLQEVALRMLLQEQEHAARCAAIAQSLGSELALDFATNELQLVRSNEPLELQLYNMLIGTYAVGEVVAHRLLRHAIAALPDSPGRDALKAIYRDEVLHAHIGPAMLRSLRDGDVPRWLPYPGDPVILDGFERAVRSMLNRDVVDPEEIAVFETGQGTETLLALGVPPSIPFKRAYFTGIAKDVPKSLEKVGLSWRSHAGLVSALHEAEENRQTLENPANEG